MNEAAAGPGGGEVTGGSGDAVDRLMEVEERLDARLREARKEAAELIREARERAGALREDPEEAFADEAEAIRNRVEEERRDAERAIRSAADRRVEAWRTLTARERTELARRVVLDVVRRHGEPLATRWE